MSLKENDVWAENMRELDMGAFEKTQEEVDKQILREESIQADYNE